MMAASENKSEVKRGQLFVGCAAFSQAIKSFPKQKGKHELDVYQEHFNAVEINNTFYGLSANSVAQWKKQSAGNFKISLKAPGYITHEGKLVDNQDGLSRLLEINGTLGKQAGPLLFQCHRSLKPDVALLTKFAGALAAGNVGDQEIAVEFRHADPIDEAALEVIRQNGWCLVIHPNIKGRITKGATSGDPGANRPKYNLGRIEGPLTSKKYAYVRLHGDNDEHIYKYSDEELTAYAKEVNELREKGLDVYVYFLNETEDFAMGTNAKAFYKKVYELTGEKQPNYPKQPKRTMQSFFAPVKKKAKT
eukprot:m.342934 g.342934  ORF g.342934 m.342934 type:complete len:306 (-) comp22040_c0_seq1:88-1005(-)